MGAQLVDDASYSPYISFESVLLAIVYFGAHVVWSSDICGCKVPSSYQLGQTEVSQLDHLLVSKKYVLRLDISMEDHVWFIAIICFRLGSTRLCSGWGRVSAIVTTI